MWLRPAAPLERHVGSKDHLSKRILCFIENTSLEPIGSVTDGRMELQGLVQNSEETIRQPFGNDECVYAAYRISESSDDDDDHSGNPAADSGKKAIPLVVEDDTGRALIETVDDAEFNLSHDRMDTTTMRNGRFPASAVSNYEAFVKRDHEDWNTSISTQQRDPDARQPYFRKWVPVGDEVYVFGDAIRIDGEAAGDTDGLSANREESSQDSDGTDGSR